MNNKETARQKLYSLHEQIVSAQKRLELKQKFHGGNKATADDLKSRYNALQAQLDEEISDLEAHDHQVSALEKSILDWMNRLGF